MIPNHDNFVLKPYTVSKIVALALLFFHFCFLAEVFGNTLEKIPDDGSLRVTGTECYNRGPFDGGEIRVFLNNSGKAPMTIRQCELSRTLPGKAKDPNEPDTQIDYLYSKLSPPVLMSGENGELLIKLLKAPSNHSVFECRIHTDTGDICKTSIPTQQAPVWITYVGFSKELDKIYVYVQNNTEVPQEIQVHNISGVNVNGNDQSINNPVPPGDKGCFIFKMQAPFRLGQYVHIMISAKSDDQEFQTQRIVRAVNTFPLLYEGGFGDSKLGLDSTGFFVETMACPEHAHGTHEEAAKKFLDDRHLRFLTNPHVLTQVWICRAGRPKAWYKFGPLPDVAVMNSTLLTKLESRKYESDMKTSEQFSPFFWNAMIAKEATAPNRHCACIPLRPESSAFARKNHSRDEIKFLVYCAIAAGAKGIVYRQAPSPVKPSRNAFVQLNMELQQLKPLLLISEPVCWVSTASGHYVTKSLLCGDEALLVMVFDSRYFSGEQNGKLYTPAFGRTVTPVKIEVKIPERLGVSGIEFMALPLSKEQWNCQEGSLNFTSQMTGPVQIYKAVFAKPLSLLN